MSGPSCLGDRPKRAPELRLPYPLLEYLQALKGDYMKLALRLLQRAQWKAGVTETGIAVDAGEVLISLRSHDVWDAVRLDRRLSEAGRVSLMRRVLDRLERDGIVATRPARRTDTPGATQSGTSNETPPTVVRFLKFRDNLWPGNQDSAKGPTRGTTHGAAHRPDPIPTSKPATPAALEERGSCADLGTSTARPSHPRVEEVRSLVARASAAYLEVRGLPYQHARRAAVMADRRAADELLSVPGIKAGTIEQVWRWVLPRTDWPRIETLPDLAAHWGVVAPRALLAIREAAAKAQASIPPLPITCPVWAEMAVRLQRNLRPDLYERWFAQLGADTSDGELVLVAADEFQRAFIHDNYLGMLEELLGRVRSQHESYLGIKSVLVTYASEAGCPGVTVNPEPTMNQETFCHAQHQA